MVKYEDTVELSKLKPNDVEQIIDLGLSKKIKIYGVGTMLESSPIPLRTGQIAFIKSNHPQKSTVIIDGYKHSPLYLTPPYDEQWLNQGRAIRASIYDLRICKSDLADIKTESTFKTKSIKSENADTAMLGACLEFIEGKTPGIPAHPSFENSTKFIELLANKYKGFSGMSQSNLSRKFPQAKKILEPS